jgi:hypothetical protein
MSSQKIADHFGSEALLDEYGDQLNEGGQNFPALFAGRKHKMRELTDGPVELSRSTREGISLE